MHRFHLLMATLFLTLSAPSVHAADANRLAYLDDQHPYHVGQHFPKLTTPMWVGEDGVEAVVILSIDDMRGHEKWETFLRPVLRRLQKIDGRAPVSIMTCQIDPKDPHLQTWLKEGLSLETHTFDHPCPLLQVGDFSRAKKTYDRSLDLLAAVSNTRPVAFRMPCCDSLNTLSPRFFRHIFNEKTDKGNFLTIDSSVFNLLTSNDPALPRELVIDADGQDRFLKYLPADRTFVNTIENYPYPYVIYGRCWEFPCVTPSDWAAQHRHKPNNPQTVRDWKAALDAVVIKQGVFPLVFHPHGWIKPEQLVELIDHAVAKHGKKVKFLTFRDAQERLNKHLLGGHALRHPENGQDNGVRLLDVNNDGFIDVVIGNEKFKQTRLWSPREKAWTTLDFPTALANVGAKGERVETGVRFGVSLERPWALVSNEAGYGSWLFDKDKWIKDARAPVSAAGEKLHTSLNGRDRGVRLRDLARSGDCQVIVTNETQSFVLSYGKQNAWTRSFDALPPGAAFVDADGKDAGLRLVDIDGDGFDDLIFSNEKSYGLYLYGREFKKVLAGKVGEPNALPMITRKGEEMGAWFHSRHLWVQNEHTALLKDLVDRRSFNEMLAKIEPTAKSAPASLRSIQLRPGFVVEQMAGEPQVQDPIAMAWGPDGKLWVVEMGDYPLGIDGKGKPGGKVTVLESTKGDGKYDKATVFLDGLPFPTSILPWRKGVLIICAPDILYCEDTDGDGKADRREKLYTGFNEGNQQHRANSLVYGLDNWIYCANGDSGGTIKSLKTGKVVNLSGRDFRIRPDTGDIDLQSGQTQYGRSRDDWGNWFGGNNSSPVWHYALADHYIRRNPHLAAPDPRVQVSVTPGAAVVFPASRTTARFNNPESSNHFTSACSPIVYRDDLFGPHFAGNSFVSEPVHNLVHREIMTAKGVTFTSQRPVDEEHSEFFASTDNWCRPTSLQTGPDGALWIADMYRHVIEHPQWIPLDWQKRLDLRAGHDQGRIYRVFPVGVKPRSVPRLDRLNTAELVAALDSPSGWQRDLAQMMLLWRNDRSASPLLAKQARDSQRPLCRLHSLCTLDGFNVLSPALIKHALQDAHPGVRRHALRLCEARLAKSPELGEAMLKLGDDADAPVRMQLAYSLGAWDDPRAGTALGHLARKDAADRYMSAAILSSVNGKNLDEVIKVVMSADQAAPPAALVDSLLRLASAENHTKALATLLTSVAKPKDGKYTAWHFTALAGLLDALEQRNLTLAKLRDSDDPDLKTAVLKLNGVFVAARQTLLLEKPTTAEKLLAVPLLGRGLEMRKEEIVLLSCYLGPRTPDDLQAAVVASLGRLSDPSVTAELLRGWKGYGPKLRGQVLDVLLRRGGGLKVILDALDSKTLATGDLDASRRQRLLEHRDSAVRSRAAKLFAGLVNADRQKVIDAYQAVLTLSGDAAKGAPIFAKQCSTCHKLGTVGNIVGPDLASVGDKSAPGLLIAILDPNRVVEARYVNYSAVTRAGLTLTGILASETGNSITLIGQDGKAQTILRKDLDELISTGKSLMPEGLEKEIPPAAMADLLAFVRSATPQPNPKSFPGNRPELVQPAADGALLLSAKNAEIHGKSLVFEPKFSNLGFWSSDDDHAIWTVAVPRAGRYTVELDWACPNASAGKTYILQAGANALSGKVTGTGGWETYKQAQVGTLILTAGKQRLTFRPAGRLASSAMLDLRSIKLVPVKE